MHLYLNMYSYLHFQPHISKHLNVEWDVCFMHWIANRFFHSGKVCLSQKHLMLNSGCNIQYVSRSFNIKPCTPYIKIVYSYYYIQEYPTEHVCRYLCSQICIWYKGWLFSKKLLVLKKLEILICITLSFQFFEENELLRVAGVYKDLGTRRLILDDVILQTAPK